MDKILYSEVSTLVDHATANASFVMSTLNSKYEQTGKTEVNQKIITEILNEAEKYMDFLHNFKQSFAEGKKDFSTIKDSLSQFIYRLVQLNVALDQKQNQRINFTDEAIRNRDNSGYFVNEKQESFLANPSDKKYQTELEAATSMKNTIQNLVKRTDERITAAFGEFDSQEKADKIINMEFDHVTRYIIGLKQLREMGYTEMDNVIPVMATISTLVYECFQLNDVITRAERFYQAYDKDLGGTFRPYYIVMKGISSAQNVEQYKEFTNRFIESTYMLNQELRSQPGRKLVCQFDFCKDNEVHGIVNARPEDFVKLVAQTFRGINLRMAYSYRNIDSMKNHLMRMPYELYGGIPEQLADCEASINSKGNYIAIENGKVVLPKQTKDAEFGNQ